MMDCILSGYLNTFLLKKKMKNRIKKRVFFGGGRGEMLKNAR